MPTNNMPLTYCGASFDEFFKFISPDFETASSGNVDAPTGYFAVYEVDEAVVNACQDEFGAVLPPGDQSQVPGFGWYLVVSDSLGFVWVYSDTQTKVQAAYDQLQHDFALWDAV